MSQFNLPNIEDSLFDPEVRENLEGLLRLRLGDQLGAVSQDVEDIVAGRAFDIDGVSVQNLSNEGQLRLFLSEVDVEGMESGDLQTDEKGRRFRNVRRVTSKLSDNEVNQIVKLVEAGEVSAKTGVLNKLSPQEFAAIRTESRARVDLQPLDEDLAVLPGGEQRARRLGALKPLEERAAAMRKVAAISGTPVLEGMKLSDVPFSPEQLKGFQTDDIKRQEALARRMIAEVGPVTEGGDPVRAQQNPPTAGEPNQKLRTGIFGRRTMGLPEEEFVDALARESQSRGIFEALKDARPAVAAALSNPRSPDANPRVVQMINSVRREGFKGKGRRGGGRLVDPMTGSPERAASFAEMGPQKFMAFEGGTTLPGEEVTPDIDEAGDVRERAAQKQTTVRGSEVFKKGREEAVLDATQRFEQSEVKLLIRNVLGQSAREGRIDLPRARQLIGELKSKGIDVSPTLINEVLEPLGATLRPDEVAALRAGTFTMVPDQSLLPPRREAVGAFGSLPQKKTMRFGSLAGAVRPGPEFAPKLIPSMVDPTLGRVLLGALTRGAIR